MSLTLEKILPINGKQVLSPEFEEAIATSQDLGPVTLNGIDSPFGYYGSKHRLASRISKLLPPHHAWVEVFCGSASLTLAKSPAPIEVINDIDGNIVNLFKQLRENPNSLIGSVVLTPYSREELKNSKISSDEDSDIERARKFLVSSMMTVNGAFGRGTSGFSHSDSYTRNGMEARVSRWVNLPNRLIEVAQRLSTVRIENLDALYLMTYFLNRPATLLYLDPPYFMKRSHGYTVDANNEEFHIELLWRCNNAKCMILISSYENELYNRILKKKYGWQKETIETTTRGTNGKDFVRTEVLWKNRHYLKAEKSNKVPIRLTKEEKAHKKINPERGKKKMFDKNYSVAEQN